MNCWCPFGYEQYIVAKSVSKQFVLRWFGELHFGVRLRGRYLASALKGVNAATTILDVGCNCGQTSFWLHRRFPNASIKGLDIDHSLIEHCQSIARKLDVCKVRFDSIDLLDLREKNEYDLIICFDVLEHIADWETALHRLVSALKPGGRLLVHTPHKGYFQSSQFGLRRWFTASVANGHSEHVREGFVPEDFSVLAKRGLDCEIKFTFGSLTMWLHTFFEMYRNRSWLWHLVFTLPLLTLGIWDARVGHSIGGGLLIQASKVNGTGEKRIGD